MSTIYSVCSHTEDKPLNIPDVFFCIFHTSQTHQPQIHRLFLAMFLPLAAQLSPNRGCVNKVLPNLTNTRSLFSKTGDLQFSYKDHSHEVNIGTEVLTPCSTNNRNTPAGYSLYSVEGTGRRFGGSLVCLKFEFTPSLSITLW